MAKWREIKSARGSKNGTQRVITGLIAAGVLTIGARAADKILRGHIVTTTHRCIDSKTTCSPNLQSNQNAKIQIPNRRTPVSDLVEKYGSAAMSPSVAAAIRASQSVPIEERAKAASDTDDALQRGNWRPSADPTTAIIYGYVPPNMPPEQAATLSCNLPHLPKMPEIISSEEMAHEPTVMMPTVLDPTPAMPFGSSPSSIAAANQHMLEAYMRQRLGPGFVLPTNRGHDFPAPAARVALTSNHQGSIREMTDSSGNVIAEYSYDPWGIRMKIAGSGTDADFGFAGMYYHARSGLYLTPARPYNPILGRFLTTDPLGEMSGPNLYQYVLNNPISNVDPSGLLVSGTYSVSTHTLNLTDVDTGATFSSSNIFSGNGIFANQQIAQGIPFNGPIPQGTYSIDPESTMPAHAIIPWYSLGALPGASCPWRKGCGIHPGSVSYGCMTFPGSKTPNGGYDSPSFNDLATFLNGTNPGLANSPAPALASPYLGLVNVIP